MVRVNDTSSQRRESGQRAMHVSAETAQPGEDSSALAVRPTPWPIGASILWAIAALGVQYAVILLVIAGSGAASGQAETLRALTPYSPLVWLASIVAAPAQLAVLAFAVRKRGGFMAYLALANPDRRSLVLGFGSMALLIPLLDLITYALGRDVTPPFLIDAYRSAQAAGALLILVVAVVVVAPVWEELLFRGFLFRGFCQSRAGPKAAVVVTSVIWAAMHLQYDWFGVVQVFVIGLVLGWLRLRSGSALLTIPLHMTANLVALAETAVKVEWLS